MKPRSGALRALSSFAAAALVATSGVLGGIAGAASARPQHVTPRPKVKNVIVMISDGAGYNQFLAADYFQNGQGGSQRFEKFPVAIGTSHFAEGGSYDPSLAWSDFDYVKQNPTDSAAAATAMSTGRKAWSAAIGMIGSETSPTAVEHLAERAEKLGKSTGVVTTVEWSHATPAGFVAHNVSRNNYEAIASEMVNRSATDVIMGSGHPWFTDDGKPITKTPSYKYVGGASTWDRLLRGTAGADADGDGDADPFKLIQTRAEFRALAKGKTPRRVCGTFQTATTAQQARSGSTTAAPYAVPLNDQVPTLAEMTTGALNVLDNNKRGFFLMVEGGAVDWAGHANQSGRVIEEQIDFNKSVDSVIRWVNANSSWDETLVIVTGDHETGYLTGPGAGTPASNAVVNNGKGDLPGMKWNSGDHTNSLIPLFARGTGARKLELQATNFDPVRGRYVDNTDIAKTVFEALQ